MPRFSLIQAPFNLEEYDLVIDVRSPSEFAEDHILGAINLPVLNDLERKEIGIIYKENTFEASRLGAAKISINIASIISNELAELPHRAKMLIYCWRGNQRSRSIAHVLSSIGWNISLIHGGYKYYRSQTIETTETFFNDASLQLKVISGYTGTGKTHFLTALKESGHQVIDLEGLANHKGSLFGADASLEQPSQKRFENLLATEIRQFDLAKPIYIEAESNRIGNVFCPPALWLAMKEAEVIDIELAMASRVEIIKQDYVHLFATPDKVIELLQKLKRIRGQAQVDSWISSVNALDWDALVASLLEHHYDLAYRDSGSEGSPYNTPSQRLKLTGSTQQDYLHAAKGLA